MIYAAFLLFCYDRPSRLSLISSIQNCHCINFADSQIKFTLQFLGYKVLDLIYLSQNDESPTYLWLRLIIIYQSLLCKMIEGLKIIADLLISFSGIVLLFSGQQRNRFYTALSQFLPNEQEDQKTAELVLIVFCFLLISFSIVESLFMKIFSIIAFLVYNVLCFTGINKEENDIVTPFFLSNMILLWIAVKENFQYFQMKTVYEKNKAEIKSHHRTYQQTWYPMEYPVESNDIQSAEHEVERIRQIVNLPPEKLRKLEHRIQSSIKEQQELIKKYKEDEELKRHETDFNEIVSNQSQIDRRMSLNQPQNQNKQIPAEQQDDDFDPYYEQSKPQIIIMTNFSNK